MTANLYRQVSGYYTDLRTRKVSSVPFAAQNFKMKRINAAIYHAGLYGGLDAAYVHRRDSYNPGHMNIVEVWDVRRELEDGKVGLDIGPSGKTIWVDPSEPIYYC